MPLRRAYWVNDAEVRLDHVTYAVGYKHHLDRVEVNPGEVTTFYQYRGRDEKEDQPGTAWEWGEELKLRVQRTGKIVIAEPEWDGGKLCDAVCVDCYGEKLLIDVKAVPFETIKIGIDAKRALRGWAPKGYTDADHIRNHPDIRRI